jgi:branched-chain amino acid transport system permease protein
MSEFSSLVQILMAGVTAGSIYALAALGFSLVFAVNGFLNLVQGEFVVLGGLVTISLTAALGMPVLPAALAAILVSCVVGFVLQRLALSPRRRLSADAALMVTIGAAFIVRGADMIVFGRDMLSLPSFSGEKPIAIGEIAISTQSLWILGALATTSVALWWFFNRTFSGKAMLACAASPTGAQLVGINLGCAATAAYVTSAGLGSIAGVVVAPLNFVSYDEGLAVGIKGFIAAMIGGIGSYPGAVVGGVMLGVIESLSAGYISSLFRDASAFLVLLVVLLLFPNGLLGQRR